MAEAHTPALGGVRAITVSPDQNDPFKVLALVLLDSEFCTVMQNTSEPRYGLGQILKDKDLELTGSDLHLSVIL
ncbi:unnamed protein product [Gadus morhua 'NCC']